ncbi:MAG: (d)CMP kinase [Bacteroidetes bacterium]|nr:(d)CMP kinase [Bacteroidota bacterium]
MKYPTIAIDGYSSCGKSTLAKDIANALNYVYVDSGAMYRAFTLHLINKGLLKDGAYLKSQVIEELNSAEISFRFNTETQKSETYLNGINVEKDIRSSAISRQVSPISAIGEVRTKMVAIQQQMGLEGRVVMDGRDIGTVVFPNAEVKLFMTASNDIRAQRRIIELHDKGEQITLDDVKKSLAQRDYQDMHREISPLQKAVDAIEIDNSELTRDEQLKLALSIIHQRIETLQFTS